MCYLSKIVYTFQVPARGIPSTHSFWGKQPQLAPLQTKIYSLKLKYKICLLIFFLKSVLTNKNFKKRGNILHIMVFWIDDNLHTHKTILMLAKFYLFKTGSSQELRSNRQTLARQYALLHSTALNLLFSCGLARRWGAGLEGSGGDEWGWHGRTLAQPASPQGQHPPHTHLAVPEQ